MLPTQSEYGKWPASGEIDIMENVGYDPDHIVGTAHTQRYNHTKGTQKSATLRRCPGGRHPDRRGGRVRHPLEKTVIVLSLPST